MKKFVILAGAVAVLLLALGGLPALADDGDKGDFRAHLDGWEEVPSQVTTGSGSFRAELKSETLMTYVLKYSAMEGPVTQAHIHVGSRHENGGISVFLCGGGDKPPCPPTAGEVRGEIDPTDVIGPTTQGVEVGNMADLLRAMRAGESYANVHSTPRAPGGEIRGQIKGDGRSDKGDGDDDD